MGRCSAPVTGKPGIAKDVSGFLLTDFMGQRVIRLTDTFTVKEFIGSHGMVEKEFINPSLVHHFENRIFVYDEGRCDIQVFDYDFNSLTRLRYSTDPDAHNYVEPEFFHVIKDINVITGEESGRLYYYALLLSASTGKLAVIKLPQWDELRVRVRNNKIIFIKEDDVFTAKPDGADIKRIISSDSIPRIDGTLDYPALSPDGRKIVFTSCKALYAGSTESGEPGTCAYDNLYMIDVDGNNLKRIPLAVIDEYEIIRPVFSSNGDKLILSAKPAGGKWQIFIYDFESGSINPLFEDEIQEDAKYPCFSPDDRFVIFTTNYDGDEEIEIVNLDNTKVRLSVTSNNSRDSYPVWGPVYQGEIKNPDLDIHSKIVFISERNYYKGLYSVYVAQPSESVINIVTRNGEYTGNPEDAAFTVTNSEVSADYPALTGDGKSCVFEYDDGTEQYLMNYHFDDETFTRVPLPGNSVRPAGMKNSISNFQLRTVNGDQVHLSWTRYTDANVFYQVQYRINSPGEPVHSERVFTQDSAVITGLKMGVEYLFKVGIIENNEEAASTQWKKITMPKVAARPSFRIDNENPYMVLLEAWKPDPETEWYFTWIIDNQKFPAETSVFYPYEFSTSGKKSISLEARDKSNTYTNISGPMTVEIFSDINPVIEYKLRDGGSTIELDASQSTGNKVQLSEAVWTISGPGRQPFTPQEPGSRITIDLTGFRSRINVHLKLKRTMISGQTDTDIVEKTITVDLTFEDVKPVITCEQDEKNDRLFRFSGEHSLGNIDWSNPNTTWVIFADGGEIYRQTGVSSFAYQFPPREKEASYSVSLTIPRAADGKTATSSIIVAIEPCPIEPVIDHEIVTVKEGAEIISAKLLLSCTNSRGSNIDYANAKWNVPAAATYSDAPSQTGPTAIYNLQGKMTGNTLIDVTLTLSHRGENDPKTITEVIPVEGEETMETEIIVKTSTEQTASGMVLVFDALDSRGPNIEWDKIEWLINGQYTSRGPAARMDLPESGEDRTISYICTLSRTGFAPVMKKGSVQIDKCTLTPVINYSIIGGSNRDVYEFNVLETGGMNIDWEKTRWHIYDGNSNVIHKNGARISHVFEPREDAYGYPVKDNLYLFPG